MKAVGILSALLLATCTAPTFAQISKEQVKERKLIKSSTQSELKQKASKVARKVAKELYKEGWIKLLVGYDIPLYIANFPSIYINNIFSQKIERVHGEYTYYLPENISSNEGKHIALERTKFQTIFNAFRTFISQSNSTAIRSSNSKSNVDLHSLGGSDLK